MQIRELTLQELDTVYEMIELEYDLSYDEFEDLIYEMREYKMFGIFECGILITYAGVSIETNLLLKRHLKIHEFISVDIKNSDKYAQEMKSYLQDFAKISACEKIIIQDQKNIFYL